MKRTELNLECLRLVMASRDWEITTPDDIAALGEMACDLSAAIQPKRPLRRSKAEVLRELDRINREEAAEDEEIDRMAQALPCDSEATK